MSNNMNEYSLCEHALNKCIKLFNNDFVYSSAYEKESIHADINKLIDYISMIMVIIKKKYNASDYYELLDYASLCVTCEMFCRVMIKIDGLFDNVDKLSYLDVGYIKGNIIYCQNLINDIYNNQNGYEVLIPFLNYTNSQLDLYAERLNIDTKIK